MRRVLIIAGATASGKTTLAIELAGQLNAEIIGADSRQVYRGMSIGTAAPTARERSQVAHHLVEFLDPQDRYSAARFARDATRAICDIHSRGKHAIVVGGTGFYIRALMGGVTLAPQYDADLRARLADEARVHSAEFLHEWLRLRDPVRANAIDPNDQYRVLRALEIALIPESEGARDDVSWTIAPSGLAFVGLFLDVPFTELDERIARRTEMMLREGLVAEAESIGWRAVAASAVGYPQALAYLAGWSSESELVSTLARATRRYARRQRAWFRNEPTLQWVGRDRAIDCAKELLDEP